MAKLVTRKRKKRTFDFSRTSAWRYAYIRGAQRLVEELRLPIRTAMKAVDIVHATLPRHAGGRPPKLTDKELARIVVEARGKTAVPDLEKAMARLSIEPVHSSALYRARRRRA
jgi:hypothetical protein